MNFKRVFLDIKSVQVTTCMYYNAYIQVTTAYLLTFARETKRLHTTTLLLEMNVTKVLSSFH
jgi:hypothetical protein